MIDDKMLSEIPRLTAEDRIVRARQAAEDAIARLMAFDAAAKAVEMNPAPEPNDPLYAERRAAHIAAAKALEALVEPSVYDPFNLHYRFLKLECAVCSLVLSEAERRASP